jgi:hypothetical protein
MHSRLGIGAATEPVETLYHSQGVPMQRVRRYEAIDFSRWAGIVQVEADDDKWYECYWLKLPSYGLHFDYYRGRNAWCQLVLFWHGRDGLSHFWKPSQLGDRHGS